VPPRDPAVRTGGEGARDTIVGMDDNRDDSLERLDEASPLKGSVLYALSDALKSKASKEALARLIESTAEVVKKYADGISDRLELPKRALWQGTLLTAFIVIVIAGLGWLKIITSESTATLIAALLGYLFFQRKAGK
jgi:hypothetical protein